MNTTISPKKSGITSTVSILPCHIDYNGPAPVEEYFKDHFRGRKLVGTEVKLPVGYTGHVLDSSDKGRTTYTDNTQTEERTWHEKSRFERVTVYGNSAAVGDDSVYVRGIVEWTALAGVIHDKDP